jgi:hypothetical protein
MLVFNGLLLKLLAEPTTVLFGDGGDQPAGVFVALQFDHLELMQQADLQLNYNNLRFEWFKDGQLGTGITGQHELFEQVIEMADQSITEAESVLPGQALQQGHKPADQVEAGFDDRQLAAAGGAGV